SSRRRHTRFSRDWSSDVCSSDLAAVDVVEVGGEAPLDHLPGRLRGGDRLGDRLLQLPPHVVEQLGEQLALRREVLVEDGLRDAEIGRASWREGVERWRDAGGT